MESLSSRFSETYGKAVKVRYQAALSSLAAKLQERVISDTASTRLAFLLADYELYVVDDHKSKISHSSELCFHLRHCTACTVIKIYRKL